MINSPFSSKGRVRRWHFFVAFWVLTVIGNVLDYVVKQPGSHRILYVFYAVLTWPSIALMVQRAHDAGRDGKFVAIAIGLMFGSALVLALGAGLVSEDQQGGMLSIFAALFLGAIFLAGFVMTLMVYFAPGDPNTNEYGPNPRLKEATPIYAGSLGAPEDALINLAERRGYNTGD
jgi:uncharacterized membrane protein YhaH (DUF805 family)